MIEVATFTCSICGETSRDICIACTKDACLNHLCERCKRCSDCCVCEVRLTDEYPQNGKAVAEIPIALEEPESLPDLHQVSDS